MKNTKILFLTLLCFCLLLVLTSCSSRDLSTPSTRMVGHWKFGPITSCNCYDQYYFAPVAKDTLIGNLTIVSEGNTIYQKWQLISQESGGESITYTIQNPYVPGYEPTNDLNVAKDGKTMTNEYGMQYIYVDNKIEP